MNPKIKESLHRHRWRIALGVLVLIGGAVWLYLERDTFNREAILEYGESLPAGWLIAASFLLPLVAFPISIILFLTGVRFGFWPGILLTAGAMAFHHLIAYWLGHGKFRPWFNRKLENWDYKIPKIGDRQPALFTLIFAALHGPPYTLKLYLLALTDVPFRYYFWVGFPVYLAFAPIAIGAGSAVMDFDPTWIYWLVGGITVLMLATKWLKRKVDNKKI